MSVESASFDVQVFMWGLCRNQNILTPLETTFSSLDEVFAGFSFPPCSWRPFTPEGEDPIFCDLLTTSSGHVFFLQLVTITVAT